MSNTTQSSARTRLLMLLDENSFVEIGGLVTARNTDFNMNSKKVPSDGVITGYGVIDGRLVYVYSQDASVLNGTIGEMHAKKIARLYEMAIKMGAPIIGLLDCAGVRLQEATDALNGFGEIYKMQALASGIVPQICAVFGTCGGGLSVVPAMADFTFMEEKNAKLFVNTPNAIEGNTAAKCDTASAQFQSESGLVDVVADEAAIFAKIRQLAAMLPSNNDADDAYIDCADDLNRVCPDLKNAIQDPAIVFSNIADGNVFFETKTNFAKDMVTGFIRLNGSTVGVAANRAVVYDEQGQAVEEFGSVLSPNGCEKAADFVKFCDAFGIPVLTLTNVTGYKACKCAEKKMAKAAAALTYAFVNATVPKVNVVTGQAFGSAYIAMNSKSIGADMVFAWQDAKIGMMDSAAAAKIMYADELSKAEDAKKLLDEKAAEYEQLQSSAESAAKRGYVDTIIEAQDTRKYVIGAFEMLFSKSEGFPAKKHGTV